MEGFDADIGSVQSALEKAPEVFHSVRVDSSVDVRLSVVNDLVGIGVIESPVRRSASV